MKKVGKRDWIEEGFKALTDSGPQALTIEALCVRLGVTKGSFYHHFRNRQDYIKELLKDWQQETTVQIINASQSETNTGKEIDTLLRLVFTIPPERDLAVRALALYEPEARIFQEDIDRNRRTYLEKINNAFVDGAEESRLMAIIDYAWYLGIRLMFPPLDEDDKEKMIALYKKIKQSYLNQYRGKKDDNR
ncbi:MAG: TetR/AcrR family transcriptional regulator [Dehalococcoidia bacterium]